MTQGPTTSLPPIPLGHSVKVCYQETWRKNTLSLDDLTTDLIDLAEKLANRLITADSTDDMIINIGAASILKQVRNQIMSARGFASWLATYECEKATQVMDALDEFNYDFMSRGSASFACLAEQLKRIQRSS